MAQFKIYYENIFKPATDAEITSRRKKQIDVETKELNMPEKLAKRLKIISDEIGYEESKLQDFFNYIFYIWKYKDIIKRRIKPEYYITQIVDIGKISYDLDGSDAITVLKILEPYITLITQKELDEYERSKI